MSQRPADPAAFWKRLQDLVNDGYSMAVIADKVGWDCDELCRWMLAYEAPKVQKAKSYANRMSEAIEPISPNRADVWAKPNDARRFLMWRKQQMGAAEARKQIEGE